MGVTLFYMVNRRFAFGRFTDSKELFADQKDGIYKKRYTKLVSEELKDLLNQLLEPEESKRITITDALEHVWILKRGRFFPVSPDKTKHR